jgi:predicted transcriptional regulator
MKTQPKPQPPNRVPISIRLDRELARFLDDASEATGFSKTELIEQAVREHAPALILKRIHQRQDEMRVLEAKYAHPASDKQSTSCQRGLCASVTR